MESNFFLRNVWKQALCVLFFILVASSSRGQVNVDQSLTVQEYVNDVLLGEGVTATNISFIGSSEQIGYMTGGGDVNFPIEGGLILSSGNAADAFCAGQGCFGCQGGIPPTPICWKSRIVSRRSLVNRLP